MFKKYQTFYIQEQYPVPFISYLVQKYTAHLTTKVYIYQE